MALRKISHVPGEYYHIYNRGNSKQKIFTCPQEYRRFQELLYVANGTKNFDYRTIAESEIEPFEFHKGEPQVAIGAYCLMPNHFHILLSPLTDNGVAYFMKKLSTAYSMYFNAKHHRSGSLFEGRYKSQHAEDDYYLKYLFAYIHLNPIKLFQHDWREVGLHETQKAQLFLDSYTYSSHLDSKALRQESVILNLTNYPSYFEKKSDIDSELLDWLTYHHAAQVT